MGRIWEWNPPLWDALKVIYIQTCASAAAGCRVTVRVSLPWNRLGLPSALETPTGLQIWSQCASCHSNLKAK